MTRRCEKSGWDATSLRTEVSADLFRIPKHVSGEMFGKVLRQLTSHKLSIRFEITSFEPAIEIRTH